MEVFTPSLENKKILQKYLQYNKSYGCELSLANIILWSEYSGTVYTIINDSLVFCDMESGRPVSFSFPVGKGDGRDAFERICDYFRQEESPFKMHLVSPEAFEMIEKWHPGEFKIQYDRDSADYLYEWKTLAKLEGKKLHGKRNHINRFIETYPDYRYETVDSSNMADCRQIAADWAKADNREDDEDAAYELRAIYFALDHMQELNLTGGLIRAGGRAVGFTLGEAINDEVFDVHFEKAYADIHGAYAMINREFVRNSLAGYRYINREEDLGIPGLRHAKTSYQPVRLIEKGIVTR